MTELDQNRMQCQEFEALLGDALDHALSDPKLMILRAHAADCAACGSLLEEAEAGRTWLKSLVEVEPPAGLVHGILMSTTGRESRLHGTGASPANWRAQLSAWVFSPLVAVVRQPRFVMSVGMIFFCFSICLSLAGVNISDLRRVDLRPSAIKRNYYETSGRVVKYYENIRFVYEIESRVREFKRITAPAEPAQQNPEGKQRDDTSGQPDQRQPDQRQPDQRQDRNYSWGDGQHVMAQFVLPVPDAGSATSRRPL
jgi:hypothetical protein